MPLGVLGVLKSGKLETGIVVNNWFINNKKEPGNRKVDTGFSRRNYLWFLFTRSFMKLCMYLKHIIERNKTGYRNRHVVCVNMTLSVWCKRHYKCIRLWMIKNKLRKYCYLKWLLNVKNVIVYIFFFVYVFTNDIDLYWTLLVYIEGNNRVYCMTYIMLPCSGKLN